MRLLAALLCSVLAACTSVVEAPPPPINAPEPAQVASWATKTAQEAKIPEPLEVSPAHEGHALSLGPWVVCLRSTAPDHPLRYAVFFRNNDRVGYRIAVMIDRCGEETYAPLPK